MKTLVFGSLNIDLIFSVDHIVKGGETISCSSFKRSAGGKGANQAAALAKAGLSVWMAGTIGADGRFLTRLLESYGVDTELVNEYEGASGQALIQLDKTGQNSIVLYEGGNGAISEAQIERALSRFEAGDMVVLQNEIRHTALIMKKAKERGLRIALNPSPFDERIETLPLANADILFVNEIEGAALANFKEAGEGEGADFNAVLDALMRRFPHTEIILTAGKHGAYYGFKNVREFAPIVQCPVVDTTGAGDTFLGYFLAARARNLTAEHALSVACKAAALAVSRAGAMEAIPQADEIWTSK
ncbi:MAG: ribokinase [Spirochaetaceae bacterium]|jgi:ribokinase|nr:ribokinase [Spirochaetaceae bacterium]